MSIDWKDFGLQSLKLLPFFIFVALYFSLVRDDTNVILSTCLKCAPIIGLMLFVITKGIQCTEKFMSSQLILIGLAFTCIGDLLINIDLFPVGLGFFGVAHILYSADLDSEYKTWKLIILSPFTACAVTSYLKIYHHLNLALKIEIPIYMLMLCYMCWLGILCAIDRRTVFASLFAVGAVIFYTAPLLICIDIYLNFTSIHRAYIMATYYAGQFLIALSTLRETKTVSIELTAEQSSGEHYCGVSHPP